MEIWIIILTYYIMVLGLYLPPQIGCTNLLDGLLPAIVYAITATTTIRLIIHSIVIEVD